MQVSSHYIAFPLLSVIRSLSSQLHLNLAYTIASDVNGGTGIPPTQRRTGHHKYLSNLGHGYSCHGHNWTATLHIRTMAQSREKKVYNVVTGGMVDSALGINKCTI